jgi:hypothetical protein
MKRVRESPFMALRKSVVMMKSCVVCDITSCSLLKDNRRFGGTFHSPSSGSKNKLNKIPTLKLVASKARFQVAFLFSLFFDPED